MYSELECADGADYLPLPLCSEQEKPASENLPGWLMGFLNILGGAYAACALFQIGLFMVGKLQKLTGMVIVVASLLITAKA